MRRRSICRIGEEIENGGRLKIEFVLVKQVLLHRIHQEVSKWYSYELTEWIVIWMWWIIKKWTKAVFKNHDFIGNPMIMMVENWKHQEWILKRNEKEWNANQ